ncbi:MAG TPA: BTAD domain-containing putative transcriptional regulator [Kineosporiaceae bacterium]|nr:BTAD domain-containing putative transcriptional regulator [Kineosporiaceae bacterium]
MLFRILGPLQVNDTVQSGSPVRRAILTALLLRSGHAMRIGELTELLWDQPPTSAAANIRSHLTGLRRDLDQAAPGLSRRLTTHRGVQCSYGLRFAADEFDLSQFTETTRRGRSLLLQGDLPAAISTLEEAVSFWRGPFGQGLPLTRWFEAHIAGLNDARIQTHQDLFIASILAGRTEMLSHRIGALIAEAPYRQRLWELLAAVRCISGDAAGALEVIRRCQDLYADDLGLGLPPSLEEMRTAALRWDREQALRLVAAHAERPDGDGYPHTTQFTPTPWTTPCTTATAPC